MRTDSPDVDGLYRLHGAEVLNFLARRCPAGVAHDLLQEIFLQVMRQADRLGSIAMPRAWLFGIARHILAHHFRQQPAAEALAEFARQDPRENEDARMPAMREALARLPAESRDVLELRLDQEFSYEEIAEALGLPIGTVRSRLHNAVRRLREALHQPKILP